MRFSLISLILVTGAAGVLCGIFFALPAIVAAIVLFVLTFSCIPSAAIAGIVYGRGYARAFAIGTLASMGWVLSLSVYGYYGVAAISEVDSDSAVYVKIVFAVMYFSIIMCGLIAMAVRWLCLRGTDSISPSTDERPHPTVYIDPRDKAELYAILHGRIAGESDMHNGAALRTTAAETPLS